VSPLNGSLIKFSSEFFPPSRPFFIFIIDSIATHNKKKLQTEKLKIKQINFIPFFAFTPAPDRSTYSRKKRRRLKNFPLLTFPLNNFIVGEERG
jgi:hypothetical protein